jgi:hypothetical protein
VTEMLLTKAEQVSDDGASAAGLRLVGHCVAPALRDHEQGRLPAGALMHVGVPTVALATVVGDSVRDRSLPLDP